MEPAGLAVGILSLAGLFNNAVDYFEYIQIARSFGEQFETSLLKLDVVRLRLTRWGKAVGLANLDGVQSLQQTMLSLEDAPRAENILGQIQELLADAEGISNKFRQRAPSNQSIALYDPAVDVSGTPASLHLKMRDVAVRRQGKAGLRQKTKWALYEKKHFTRLIEDLAELVDGLVTLFPGAEERQRQLCEAEVAEINSRDSLSLLGGVAADQDKVLSELISKALGLSQDRSINVSFSGSHNSGFQVGYNRGTISGLHWGGTHS